MTVLESAYSAARGLRSDRRPRGSTRAPFERPQPPRPEIIDDGVAWWLVDEVSDLTGEAPAWCSRMVKEVVGAGGLGATAAFDVTYSPEYERLVVHHIRVIRNGKVREVARPEAFEIMRRERDLERAMYDGRLTAHLQIPDLRVGDIVDLCHSVIGANPVHRGWYGAAHSLQWGVAVDTVRIRMRAPARRQFDMRYWGQAPAYEERRLEGGLLEREWLAKGFPAFRYERDTPPWWVGHSKVVVAERMSWAEVAGVYAPGYESGDALPEELEAFAAELEASGATPAERAVAALRLVQRELRYLAISIGEGGLVPRPIDEVWGARAGDCKDASRLLTALLRRLSVEAAPALVNTELGWDLGDTPPNLISFNHCICRVRIDGRTWWLDATGAEQGGRLDALFQSRHGYALPLVEQAELEWMGEHETVTVVESEQDWTFPARLSSPTVARIATTYRSWRADDIRRWLRDDGPEAAAKQYRDYYEREFGEVRSTAPLKVEDRFDDNELVVEETYEFTRPFRIEDGSAQLLLRRRRGRAAPDLPGQHAPDHAAEPGPAAADEDHPHPALPVCVALQRRQPQQGRPGRGGPVGVHGGRRPHPARRGRAGDRAAHRAAGQGRGLQRLRPRDAHHQRRQLHPAGHQGPARRQDRAPLAQLRRLGRDLDRHPADPVAGARRLRPHSSRP